MRPKTAARPRGPRPRHERLSARPRDPDAAGDHLQRPGQPAARPRALHQDACSSSSRADGIPRGDRAACRRPSRAGGASPTRRSTSTWPIRAAWQQKLDARGPRAAGPDARAGDDPARAALAARRARADDARGEDRSRQATAASPARTWSRTPRAIRSSKSSCWRPTRPWPRLLAEAELHFLRRVHQAARPAQAEGADRVRHRAGLRGRKPGKPLRAAEAAGRRGRPARAARRQLRRCCAACSGPSTAPRTKATTRWPATATATSPRRFAAIPT